jgi:hypothetical protein
LRGADHQFGTCYDGIELEGKAEREVTGTWREVHLLVSPRSLIEEGLRLIFIIAQTQQASAYLFDGLVEDRDNPLGLVEGARCSLETGPAADPRGIRIPAH